MRPLDLVVEVRGECDVDKADKAATARSLRVNAVNNAATWGRCDFIEIADMWDVANTTRAQVKAAQKETPAPAPPQGREKEVRGLH